MKYNQIIPIEFSQHPIWGDATLYRLHDTETGKQSLGLYTNEEAAKRQLERINNAVYDCYPI